jgi:hypothetical protein
VEQTCSREQHAWNAIRAAQGSMEDFIAISLWRLQETAVSEDQAREVSGAWFDFFVAEKKSSANILKKRIAVKMPVFQHRCKALLQVIAGLASRQYNKTKESFQTIFNAAFKRVKMAMLGDSTATGWNDGDVRLCFKFFSEDSGILSFLSHHSSTLKSHYFEKFFPTKEEQHAIKKWKERKVEDQEADEMWAIYEDPGPAIIWTVHPGACVKVEYKDSRELRRAEKKNDGPMDFDTRTPFELDRMDGKNPIGRCIVHNPTDHH